MTDPMPPEGIRDIVYAAVLTSNTKTRRVSQHESPQVLDKPRYSSWEAPGETSMPSLTIDFTWESGCLFITTVISVAVTNNRLLSSVISITAARSSRSLTERRVTHIVSVCTDAIPAELPESGICHLRIPVEDIDFADLLIWLPRAVQFIDQALRNGGNVLVHCAQGLSRSAAVVAAYLMYAQRVNATQALEMVRRRESQYNFAARTTRSPLA
ncbi:hypothetical protein EYR40_005177 [Pleurotus pulmonarius]|nr:hypothetical protein EYR40_005177 [Pleurotus pulmonarius]